MNVVDCHAHVNPPGYVDEVISQSSLDPSLRPIADLMTGGSRDRFPLAYGGIDRRLELMDAAGIAVEYLSSAAPYPRPSDSGIRLELARAWNDATTQLAAGHPGRFQVMATVPLPDVDGALAETERMLDFPTTAGVMIHTHTERIPVDDPRWFPLYEDWNERGLLVFLHPDGFCVKDLLEDDLNWDVGTQLDDTIAAVRLFSNGILARFPRIRWIVPHLGGALPFILGRLDQHWERDRGRRTLERPPSESLEGLLFDTAGHDGASIKFALEVLGANRIVFGSDFPMVGADDLMATVQTACDACNGASEKEAVLAENMGGGLSVRG